MALPVKRFCARKKTLSEWNTEVEVENYRTGENGVYFDQKCFNTGYIVGVEIGEEKIFHGKKFTFIPKIAFSVPFDKSCDVMLCIEKVIFRPRTPRLCSSRTSGSPSSPLHLLLIAPVDIVPFSQPNVVVVPTFPSFW